MLEDISVIKTKEKKECYIRNHLKLSVLKPQSFIFMNWSLADPGWAQLRGLSSAPHVFHLSPRRACLVQACSFYGDGKGAKNKVGTWKDY